MELRVSVWSACAQLFVCCFVLHATTLQRMSLQRMIQAAQVIVRARCVSNHSLWDSGEIWTDTTFTAEEAWKGTPAKEVRGTFNTRLLGGTIGALTSHVSGVPRFRPGEDVLIFLQPTSHGDLSVVGWMQGTFRIRRDSHNGKETVTQDTAAFDTFDPQTRRFEATGIRNMSLSLFRQQVATAVAHGGAQ
ncbi:MAG TPA: hypothetical protein VMF66_15075 [Candidatus Acidoferrum sp.]|nr:hypothetical protein [Candidatus Acidoferrum sp.]